MAFNYENPHDDPNLGNYDYYVNEVKDFQRKLDEYQESVDQKLADQDADITNLQNQVNGQINGLRNEVRDFEERITNEVDSINEHTETYVNNYLTENITEILETNPVLETKYTRVGTIAANSSITINLEQNKIYDIMCLNYAFDLVKILASNNTAQIVQAPIKKTTVVNAVFASETTVPDIGTVVASITPAFTDPVILYYYSYITISVANNVLTLTNSSGNVITVYDKIIFG